MLIFQTESHECHNITMSVTVNIKILNTEFSGTFITYRNTRFHMPNSNASFVITMQPRS